PTRSEEPAAALASRWCLAHHDHGQTTVGWAVMIVASGVLPQLQNVRKLLLRDACPPILLLWDGTAAHAVQALCPHRGAPLADGFLTEGVLVCAWHRSVFRIKDGAIVAGPAQVSLRVLAVTVCGDDVMVEDE
ncbi:MAG: Rieske 2Fe-2S domain-containing protein, partial [Actinomycetota bacterium]|nr:Rieske 2Fe-2S domain-containing protein [Actinomycetota bacterium]